MKKRIVLDCPHCNKPIGIFTEVEGETVIIEAFSRNNTTGELYSPRGKWKTKANKLDETINFLLRNWAILVEVRNLNGKLLNKFAK